MKIQAIDRLGVYLSNRMNMFFLMFVLLYTCLEFLYFKIPNFFLFDVIYHHGLVRPSAAIINFIRPEEHVVAAHNIISTGVVALEVVRGCDGAGTFFLMIAAILTFPASLKLKAVGLVTGVALLSVINLFRIIVLYFVMVYQGQWFTPVHTYFAPTFIIIVGCLFFARWAQYASANK